MYRGNTWKQESWGRPLDFPDPLVYLGFRGDRSPRTRFEPARLPLGDLRIRFDTKDTQAGRIFLLWRLRVKFGSVCSGIEAASTAWEPLGWTASWFAEIEPFPCAVLAHHWPDTPNLGDFTAIRHKIASGDLEAPDVLVGGTPCQAFSVAGLRKSLDDQRGQLTIQFVGLADAIDDRRRDLGLLPAIIVWENVPGVLNTSDNAFGCFLAAVAGNDAPLVPPGGRWTDAGFVRGPRRSLAWRVQDAQYHGLAQRRRRVFLVASAGEGFCPEQVLFEFDGVRRDSPPCREQREGAAPNASESTGSVLEAGVPDIAGPQGKGFQPDLGYTLEARHHARAVAFEPGITARLGGHAYPDVSGTLRKDSGDNQMAVAFAQNTRDEVRLQAGDGSIVGALAAEPGMKQTSYVAFQGVSDCLTSSYATKWNGNASADNGSLFALGTDMYNGAITGDVAATLGTPGSSVTASGPTVAVAFNVNAQADQLPTEYKDTSVSETLTKSQNSGVAMNRAQAMQVRRLTPEECERLQGFPVGHTRIPWRGKAAEDCPDGPRYKALGNSMAVPCMTWIAKRIIRHLEGEI